VTDIRVQREGTIFLLHPLTEHAEDWFDQHFDRDSVEYFGKALVVEHSFVVSVVEGALEDGLEVE
jgi:hypothetical protein